MLPVLAKGGEQGGSLASGDSAADIRDAAQMNDVDKEGMYA